MDKTKLQLEEVRSDWAGRSKHWDQRADEVADMASRINMPLIQAAKIAADHKVLDLATGAGEPALTIAEMVGKNGHVTATDLVPEMMAGAKRRARDMSLENISFEVADMADLPFSSDRFDRATCRFGLMFSPEKQKAVNEVFRVLKPGGRVAYMVWGEPADNTMAYVIKGAARDVFGDDNPLLELDLPFSLSEPGSLTALLKTAGFEAVEETPLRRQADVPVGKLSWDSLADMTAGRARDAADEAMQAAFNAEVDRRFAAYIENGAHRIGIRLKLQIIALRFVRLDPVGRPLGIFRPLLIPRDLGGKHRRAPAQHQRQT